MKYTSVANAGAIISIERWRIKNCNSKVSQCKTVHTWTILLTILSKYSSIELCLHENWLIKKKIQSFRTNKVSIGNAGVIIVSKRIVIDNLHRHPFHKHENGQYNDFINRKTEPVAHHRQSFSNLFWINDKTMYLLELVPFPPRPFLL